MKPIIINMSEVSDSVEMYNSKPNKAIPITIFTLAFMFIATIIWRKNYSPKSSAQFFSVDHDYILIYVKYVWPLD